MLSRRQIPSSEWNIHNNISRWCVRALKGENYKIEGTRQQPSKWNGKKHTNTHTETCTENLWSEVTVHSWVCCCCCFVIVFVFFYFFASCVWVSKWASVYKIGTFILNKHGELWSERAWQAWRAYNWMDVERASECACVHACMFLHIWFAFKMATGFFVRLNANVFVHTCTRNDVLRLFAVLFVRTQLRIWARVCVCARDELSSIFGNLSNSTRNYRISFSIRKRINNSGWLIRKIDWKCVVSPEKNDEKMPGIEGKMKTCIMAFFVVVFVVWFQCAPSFLCDSSYFIVIIRFDSLSPSLSLSLFRSLLTSAAFGNIGSHIACTFFSSSLLLSFILNTTTKKNIKRTTENQQNLNSTLIARLNDFFCVCVRSLLSWKIHF